MTLDISALSVAAARRIDAACDRFEEALQSGRSWTWEEFLESCDSVHKLALLRQLLLVEWEYRQRSDRPLDLSEYVARFPEHATLVLQAGEEHTIEHADAVEPATSLSPAAQRAWEALGYTVLRPLGCGGTGTVYLAFQAAADRLVAIKVLTQVSDSASASLNRFRREAQILARLEHPHIVPLFDAGEHQGRPFYSMEYCPAGSLADHLRHGRLDPQQAAALVERLAHAVHAAHQRGIVHRDLKPSNVLLSSECEIRDAESRPETSAALRTPHSALRTPKLADFGLARKLDATAQTHTGTVLGTPQYMAPEQARGEGKDAGAATDVYGLGALLYECLTGRPPFSGATVLETMLQVITRDAPAPTRFQSGIPRGLETICLTCLNKEPARRYPDAAALAEDLRRFQAGRPIRARRARATKQIWQWFLRYPVAASLLVAVVVAGAISLPLIGWALDQRDDAIAASKLEAVRRDYDRALAAEPLEGSAGVLLRLAVCLNEAVDARAVSLEESIRRQLGAWSRNIVRLRNVFIGHEGNVFAVAYSPDGTKVLTGSGDRTARLWDVASGQCIMEFRQHTDTVFAVAFSPDGEWILTGSADGTARLWDIATGEPIGRPLEHDYRVLAVAFSRDGTKLLTGSHDKNAKLWDAATCELLQTLPHPGIVRAVAFSPDGSTIVTGCDDNTVRMWQADTGKLLNWHVEHNDRVFAVAFNADGTMVLTGSQDKTARVWHASTAKSLSPPLEHGDTVFGVSFSPDGKVVLTASDDKTARLWDATTGLALGIMQHEGEVRSAAYHKNGKSVLTGSWEGVARQWEIDVPTHFKHHETVQTVAFSPDGTTVLTTSGDQTARLWDLRGEPIGQVMQHDGWVGTAVFSPDGNFVLTGSADKTARLWDARTGKPVGSPLVHQGPVWRVAFSPDSKSLVTASKDGRARLWSTATCELLCPPMEHAGPVFTVIFSPDGKTILTGGLDRFARLWDAATGKLLAPPLEHQLEVGVVAFRRDGTKVATGSNDGKAQLWDAKTGRPLGPAMQHRLSVDFVTFSPDGRIIVTASQDKSAQLWDVETCQPLHPPLWHRGAVAAATFSRDGTMLLTASDEDHMARLWDTSTGTRLGPPLLHHAGVVAVAFNRDGGSILTGSRDGISRLWKIHPPVQGDPQRVMLWAQAATGMQLNDRGGIEKIDSPTWQALRERLTSAGGIPAQLAENPGVNQ